MSRRDPRRLRIILPLGAFVEVTWLPDDALHKFYLGRTGSIVQRDSHGVRGIYEVQFEDYGAGSFRVESLRLV